MGKNRGRQLMLLRLNKVGEGYSSDFDMAIGLARHQRTGSPTQFCRVGISSRCNPPTIFNYFYVLAILFAKGYGQPVMRQFLVFETNVGLAQDTSRQFGCVSNYHWNYNE